MPYATYRFNKIIAAETIRFIVTVAIVVYKGLKLVVYRMLTEIPSLFIYNVFYVISDMACSKVETQTSKEEHYMDGRPRMVTRKYGLCRL